MKNLFPPNVTTKMALDSLAADAKAELLKAPKQSRNGKIKKIKKELRDSKLPELLPSELKNSVCIGVRQCLKEIEKENVCALIFDSSVNLPALRCLVDKGKLPIAELPDLCSVLKRVVGFPGMTIGLKKNSNLHFRPLLTVLESDFVKVDEETKEKVSKRKPVAKVDPKSHPEIEILTRKEKSVRVFKPNSASTKTEEKKKVETFGSGFISFSSLDKQKNNSYKNTIINLVWNFDSDASNKKIFIDYIYTLLIFSTK